MSLNPKQLEAVQFHTGIALVVAVPGSGKTKTMTERIGRLVNDHGVSPENILGLTYTRQAAEQMRERLQAVLHEAAHRVNLYTIHGFCLRLLKVEGKFFTLLHGVEQVAMMATILRAQGIKDLPVGGILQEISLAKSNLVTPEEFVDLYGDDLTKQKIAMIFREYEEQKAMRLLLDFDDLLLHACRFLIHDGGSEKYRQVYPHILVDEYQDTNPAQLAVLKALIQEEDGSFWACGDDWQSIYAFNGASIGNILRFQQIFPSAREIVLNVNYRSTPAILAACQRLIDHNQRKIPKELIAHKPHGNDNVFIVDSLDEEEEANLVANEIKQLATADGTPLNNMAVLYRANFQSEVLQNAFVRASIPFQIDNGMGFYERREVKILLDYLRFIESPDTEQGDAVLPYIINAPNRYLGRMFMEEVTGHAAEAGCSLYQALRDMDFDRTHVRRNVHAFVRLMDACIQEKGQLGPAELLAKLRDRLDYDRFITDKDIPSPDNQAIVNLKQLLQSASRYISISEFLTYVATVEDEAWSRDPGGVRLMTIHKAKGLEFPVVFVVGLVEGIMPTKRGDLEEERRICFVALSRAMDRLYVTYSHNYLGQPAKRSMFIDEMTGSALVDKS
ncbi:ATP-dependent helicase [Solidesulfovibrio sp. C21]|uniref:ATP-dependent helicase n=1 Tax=Solidesulfovibrio sp. C21 TaxID=3398613 RepID=UPI0039FD90E4